VLNRSLDAIRHANSAGTSANGGVLMILGDDHNAQSSTLANQSEEVMMAAMVPVVHPRPFRNIWNLVLLAFGLSRFAGCWVRLQGDHRNGGKQCHGLT